MSKRIREITFVTSLSFTLVMVINAIFMCVNMTSIINGVDILTVFVTCVLIAMATVWGENIQVCFIKEHYLFYCYASMMFIATGVQYVIWQEFYWSNFFLQWGILSVIFLCVWLGIYGIHSKEASLINRKLENSEKRNQN